VEQLLRALPVEGSAVRLFAALNSLEE